MALIPDASGSYYGLVMKAHLRVIKSLLGPHTAGPLLQGRTFSERLAEIVFECGGCRTECSAKAGVPGIGHAVGHPVLGSGRETGSRAPGGAGWHSKGSAFFLRKLFTRPTEHMVRDRVRLRHHGGHATNGN
jgi:hypothetical protein